ncbi:hypothetical protein BBJ29_006871 [Phytophthora kernoviae]|uniref:WRKY19-like zinc finger domain-containing protein n=1 Tax=Phytophthora kernoviae TaxID=325452 RepID=A0A3F2RFK2_9STRA|nr:hypothetical protein BBJ29_006871 [Phytophthora kernoviae]RLN55601.1 hypothetical protein BBP00_00008421 [Phytophthora kernoviae]
MMSFRTFLPLSQPSFVEMPQLLGIKPAQPQKTKPLVNKCSLNFILSDDNQAIAKPALLPSFPWTSPQRGSSNKTFTPMLAPLSGPSKIAKRRRLQNVSVSNGSTKVSGKAGVVLTNGAVVKKGSKYCMIEGCTSRAKHARRCWRHGGSVKCKVPDCANRAKTKGVCWSHGGGTLCSFAGCATISVSNGVCWAHGGGKRCAMEGCARPAYERTDHLCTLHFEEKQYIAQQHSSLHQAANQIRALDGHKIPRA